MKAGRKFTFHGAFKRKLDAVKKERKTKGSFIRKIKFKKYGMRYVVLKERVTWTFVAHKKGV